MATLRVKAAPLSDDDLYESVQVSSIFCGKLFLTIRRTKEKEFWCMLTPQALWYCKVATQHRGMSRIELGSAGHARARLCKNKKEAELIFSASSETEGRQLRRRSTVGNDENSSDVVKLRATKAEDMRSWVDFINGHVNIRFDNDMIAEAETELSVLAQTSANTERNILKALDQLDACLCLVSRHTQQQESSQIANTGELAPLRSTHLCAHFLQYLKTQAAEHALAFWLLAEEYRMRHPHTSTPEQLQLPHLEQEKLHALALKIYHQHLDPDKEAPSIISSPVERQVVALQLARISNKPVTGGGEASDWLPPDLFVQLQERTRDWLEVNHYENWRHLCKVDKRTNFNFGVGGTSGNIRLTASFGLYDDDDYGYEYHSHSHRLVRYNKLLALATLEEAGGLQNAKTAAQMTGDGAVSNSPQDFAHSFVGRKATHFRQMIQWQNAKTLHQGYMRKRRRVPMSTSSLLQGIASALVVQDRHLGSTMREHGVGTEWTRWEPWRERYFVLRDNGELRYYSDELHFLQSNAEADEDFSDSDPNEIDTSHTTRGGAGQKALATGTLSRSHSSRGSDSTNSKEAISDKASSQVGAKERRTNGTGQQSIEHSQKTGSLKTYTEAKAFEQQQMQKQQKQQQRASVQGAQTHGHGCINIGMTLSLGPSTVPEILLTSGSMRGTMELLQHSGEFWELAMLTPAQEEYRQKSDRKCASERESGAGGSVGHRSTSSGTSKVRAKSVEDWEVVKTPIGNASRTENVDSKLFKWLMMLAPFANHTVAVEVLSGYLYKRGVLNPKWQCRWVSVTQTGSAGNQNDGLIRYFNSADVLKGTIEINKVMRVTVLRKHREHKATSGGGECTGEFTVETTNGRTFSFFVSSTEGSASIDTKVALWVDTVTALMPPARRHQQEEQQRKHKLLADKLQKGTMQQVQQQQQETQYHQPVAHLNGTDPQSLQHQRQRIMNDFMVTGNLSDDEEDDDADEDDYGVDDEEHTLWRYASPEAAHSKGEEFTVSSVKVKMQSNTQDQKGHIQNPFL